MTQMRKVLPNTMTAVGAVLGILGLVHHNVWLMVAALICDALDGTLARLVSGTSDFGKEFDWHVDVAMSHAGAWAVGAPWASLPLILLQALCKVEGKRMSGRALVWLCIIGLGVLT
jgi:phosphatidylglycerophosphate synthase